MWLPRLACSQAGIERPGRAEQRRRRGWRAGASATHGRQRSSARQTSADAEAADIGLALAADVEQAGMEGDRDGEAGEDEVGRVVERVADALRRCRRRPRPGCCSACERVLADRRSTTRPATRKASDEVDQRDAAPIVGPARAASRAAVLTARGLAAARCRPSSGRARARRPPAGDLADDAAGEHHQDAVGRATGSRRARPRPAAPPCRASRMRDQLRGG